MTAPTVLRVELRDELYAIVREPAAVFFSITMPGRKPGPRAQLALTPPPPPGRACPRHRARPDPDRAAQPRNHRPRA